MLDELPGLAKRIKDFVRENPFEEASYRDEKGEWRKAFAVMTADRLVEAAKACRFPISFPVMNDALSLAHLCSFENRVNTVPLKNLVGSGPGLVRVLNFKIDAHDPALRRSPGRILAYLQYSPLGWPDLPDMAEADLNVLFQEAMVVPEINSKGIGFAELVGTKSKAELRREWGFP